MSETLNGLYYSIVIPTLNEEKALPGILGDLVKQTLSDFEVIIVDAKSKDKTYEVANSYKDKFQNLLFIPSPKKGVAHQRNIGGAKAKGDWILFIDADTRLKKDFLEKLKRHLNKKTSDVFTCMLTPDKNKPSYMIIAKYINYQLKVQNNFNYPGAIGGLIGVRKNLFLKTTGFNPMVGYAEDGDFVRTAASNGLRYALYHNPKYVYSFRRFEHQGSFMTMFKHFRLIFKKSFKVKINQPKEYPMGGNIHH